MTDFASLQGLVLFACSVPLAGCSALTGGLGPSDLGPGLKRDDSGVAGDGDSDPGDGATELADASSDEEPGPGCKLVGTYGMEMKADVTWKGTHLLQTIPVVLEGHGELRFRTRLSVERDGENYLGTVRACSVETPDFASSLSEQYAVRFPEELWDADDMPEWNLGITSGCRDVDCSITSARLHALLGVELGDATGAWPITRKDPALKYKDHDQDGYPGITVHALNTPGYVYPPVILVPTVRAKDLMLAIRVSTSFDGVIKDCDRFEGDGPNTLVETRAAGCIHEDGSNCGTMDTVGPWGGPSAATFLDENLPKWTVKKASWTVVRVEDDATCEDVRSVTF